MLVQDCSFQTAVRDGALHTAAVAAVRLLKVRARRGGGVR